MVPAIYSFHNVLAGEKRWCVAIITGGNCFMSTMTPSVINRLHDMTISAGLGVINHVRKPFTINKGIKAATVVNIADITGIDILVAATTGACVLLSFLFVFK